MSAHNDLLHLTHLCKLYLFQEFPDFQLAKKSFSLPPQKPIEEPFPTQTAVVKQLTPQPPPLQKTQASPAIKKQTPALPPIIEKETVPTTSFNPLKWKEILKEKFPEQVILEEAAVIASSKISIPIVLFAPPPLAPKEIEMVQRLQKAISDHMGLTHLTSRLNSDDEKLKEAKILILPESYLEKFSHLPLVKIPIKQIKSYLEDNSLKIALWQEIKTAFSRL